MRCSAATRATTSCSVRSGPTTTPRSRSSGARSRGSSGKVVFYEDFPYTWWQGFQSLDDLPEGALEGIPSDILLNPRYADITDQMERKVRGIALYESQIDRLFGSRKAMASGVRQYANATGIVGHVAGAAERYWHSYQP
jgi:hypothetical protein